MRQALEVLVGHADHFGVGTRIKSDEGVLRQVRLHVDLHAVEVPEGRHGAGLALGEIALELALLGQLRGRGARGLAQRLQVHLPIGGHHGHGQVIVQFHHHGLGHLPPGDVGRPRHRLGRVGQGMRDDLIGHPVVLQELLQLRRRHGSLLKTKAKQGWVQVAWKATN